MMTTRSTDQSNVGIFDGDRGPGIQTWLGGRFYPLDPQPHDIDPRDIAVALSNLCRYTGHVSRFYSVGQHSVLAAEQAVDLGLARIMLMHDAAEAYLGDVSRPLKSLLPRYSDLEHRCWLAIAKRFDLPAEHPPEVKEIDNMLLAIEKVALQPNAEPWPGVPEIEVNGFMVWTTELAQSRWMAKFAELFPGDPVLRPVH